jgi:hypothetical protein
MKLINVVLVFNFKKSNNQWYNNIAIDAIKKNNANETHYNVNSHKFVK